MSEWIKDRNPDKDKEYLCITRIKGAYYLQRVLGWTNNLYEKDPYAFEMYKDKKDCSGWYDYDSEWGCYNIKEVFAWRELPEMPKEFMLKTQKFDDNGNAQEDEWIEKVMSNRICGHCANWRCDNPLNMIGHCTTNRLECGYGRMCDTCTKFQCKWAYTRPATEEEREVVRNEQKN